MTEEKLQVAQEHIESLEQQLADSEKKVSDANQKGIYFQITLPLFYFYSPLYLELYRLR